MLVFCRMVSSWGGRLALVAWALLVLAAPARAAIYTGIWDPAYGAPFTDLGWRGTATFYVPDACKPEGTADVSNTQDCGGLAAVSAAQVELYDVTDAQQPTLATLVFNPASLTIGTLRYLDGALVGLQTSLSNFVMPDADLSEFGVLEDTRFSLQFTLADGPRLAWGACSVGSQCTVAGFNDGQQFPPTFTVTEVPEPTTAWLAALALAGLAGLRGRRKALR